MNYHRIRFSDAEELKKYLAKKKTVTQSELNTLLDGYDDDFMSEIICFILDPDSGIVFIDDMEDTERPEEEDAGPSLAEFLYQMFPDIEESEVKEIEDYFKAHDDVELYYRDIDREEEMIRLLHGIKDSCEQAENKNNDTSEA